ncbi:MAG: copper-binding protein [Planctomycetota bacterium]
MKPTACFAAGLLSAAMSLAACGPTDPPAAATPGIDLADPDTQAYDVRGVIATLPDPGNPASDLNIRHEEIPDFVGASGEVVGMKEMTMPFPLAPGVTLEGLAVGDPVAFTFAVNWESEGSRPWELTKIEKMDEAEAAATREASGER